MHPIRRQRLFMVIFIVVIASIAVGLLSFALRENINLFYPPSGIVSGEAPIGVRIRAGGMVVDGSVIRADDSLFTRFQITDGEAQVEVHYTGILPDLFSEGEAAVVMGELDQNGIFMASEVLAKHDENYTPPEVADAMEAAHQRANKNAPEQPYSDTK
ncbi:MAG: cytochrome c maturation protein CcmE [Porticoccaceae bacterium]|nr:MAG: cytochrome c maturation protein CcmE [Porticoccaceae bacterium]